MAFFSGRYLLVCLVGLPASLVAGAAAWRLSGPLRDGGRLARSGARFGLGFAVYGTFAVVALLIGGPDIFIGPIRGGGYNRIPLTWGDVLISSLIAGGLAAFVGPFFPLKRPVPGVRKFGNSGSDEVQP